MFKFKLGLAKVASVCALGAIYYAKVSGWIAQEESREIENSLERACLDIRNCGVATLNDQFGVTFQEFCSISRGEKVK